MGRNTIEIGIVVSYKGKGDFDQERSYRRLLTGKEGSNVLSTITTAPVFILQVVRLLIYILSHYVGFFFYIKNFAIIKYMGRKCRAWFCCCCF